MGPSLSSINSLPLFPREMFILPSLLGIQAGPAPFPVPVVPGLPAGWPGRQHGRWDPVQNLGRRPRSCPTTRPAPLFMWLQGETLAGERGGGEASKVLGRASKMLILLLVLVQSERRLIRRVQRLQVCPGSPHFTRVSEASAAPCASQTAGDRDIGIHRESKMG